MQARWGTHGEHSVIVARAELGRGVLHLTVDAFNLAEQYRTPVIVLSDAMVGHMREAVALPLPEELRIAERGEPDVEPEDYDTVMSTLDNILPRPALGSRFQVHVTGLVYNRRSGVPETGSLDVAQDLGRYLREKIYHHRDAIVRVEEFMMEGAEVALFAYGSVARAARAVVALGARPGSPRRPCAADHALAVSRPTAVDRMAEQVRTVIVPEMNLKQIVLGGPGRRRRPRSRRRLRPRRRCPDHPGGDQGPGQEGVPLSPL